MSGKNKPLDSHYNLSQFITIKQKLQIDKVNEITRE